MLGAETRNYSPRAGILGAQAGGSDSLHVVERFTRVGPTEVRWHVTFTDPTTWMQPWTARMFLQKSEMRSSSSPPATGGTNALEGTLAGARHQPKAAGAR